MRRLREGQSIFPRRGRVQSGVWVNLLCFFGGVTGVASGSGAGVSIFLLWVIFSSLGMSSVGSTGSGAFQKVSQDVNLSIRGQGMFSALGVVSSSIRVGPLLLPWCIRW